MLIATLPITLSVAWHAVFLHVCGACDDKCRSPSNADLCQIDGFDQVGLRQINLQGLMRHLSFAFLKLNFSYLICFSVKVYFTGSPEMNPHCHTTS